MKTIFITGINRGLGKELFNQFLEKGYYVFGLLRNKKEFEELTLNKPLNAEFVLADVSDDNCTESIIEVVKDRKVDLIINNAGIGGKENKLDDLNSTELLELFNVHCLGVIRVLKAFTNELNGHNQITVINVNSRLGSIDRQSKGVYKNLTTSYSYRIAKASQNMLTNCLKVEFENANFISLMPGKLLTEISSSDAVTLPSESAKKIIELWEMDRLKNENGILEINENYINW